MQTYWLITEKARGLSFKIDVADATAPEAALETDPILAAERAEWKDSGDECTFQEWLECEYASVELIQQA